MLQTHGNALLGCQFEHPDPAFGDHFSSYCNGNQAEIANGGEQNTQEAVGFGCLESEVVVNLQNKNDSR